MVRLTRVVEIYNCSSSDDHVAVLERMHLSEALRKSI